MNTEAMKLALEALEHLQPTALTSFYTIGDRDKAITALQKALAQPQQDRDYTWPTVADYENDVGFKVNQAFKMAWDMARTTNSFLNQLAGVIPQPAEPQQDPVAWMAESKDGHVRFTNIGQSADELESYGWAVTPLYTSPPAQRKPLTDDEIGKAFDNREIGLSVFGCFLAGVHFAEAAHNIKENT